MILSHIDDLALKVGAEIWPDTVRNTEECTRFAHALIAKYEKAAGSEPVGLDSFVQSVPEHCDRVIWRNSYYALPIRPDPRVAELEQENERLRRAASTFNSRYAEDQERIAALLVAIEAKDAALDSLVSWVDDWAETSDTDFPRLEAQVNAARVLSPSTTLLEARDRKRDAKLLRAAEEAGDDDGFPIDIWRLADARESGEWKPEL